ncbi:type II secretion system secretin GspD [Photobacterium halotolerans]|uniref:Type II secretion system secretin GspD n=1 Tax=Photobacterium halotolerans TaxID=265726 RepID=A0A7X4XXU9_9GAMM|nr:type II secretion system secretin GspD [Photobacterium halotolerans]NAW87380.1 type II secretion system secretin GspD [Photobacterium halotolerans]NAX47247.1 type II secretion system secretin GspD [Photobacterium halotolerans]
MKKWMGKGTLWLAASLLSTPLMASEFSASFKGTDIQEFINIVGRNLEKTIIVDPSVRGQVNVRSYDLLNDEQYYQFFLNVLEVYGFAVVEMENGVLKVIRDKDAKISSIPVVDSKSQAQGDEVVTRVVAVRNVSVRELSPLLRQLNDNAGAGNVVHYDPANIIMITGRAAVVNRLADIIERVDRAGDKEIDVVELNNASAAEMVRIVDALNKSADAKSTPEFLQPKLVADERTNSVLLSGDPKVRERLKRLIRQLDKEMASSGNNRVVYLKYANAEELVDVLKGVSDNLQAEKQGNGQAVAAAPKNDVMIAAHADTNALILTAPPDIMRALENIIAQLDIRRAQVLIEAMIVELSEGAGINFGIQYGSRENGIVQFNNSNVPVGQYLIGLEEAQDTTRTEQRFDNNNNLVDVEVTESGDFTTLGQVLSGANGAVLGLIMGDWTMLVNAVATDRESNILSSPSITVMDNGEASFIVGEEVPVVTGSTASSNNDNPFQTVERKEVGIKLKVTPQINEGDSVQLKIEQEVSNVLGANGAVDVRFSKRQLTTSVLIQDGQMIALGGLIQDETNENESKIPILGDIPILGHLFKSNNTSKGRTNLMVFIKPTIIRDGVTADGITQRKYNYIRAEQLYKADEGLRLMPESKSPVLPRYGEDISLPPEVRAFVSRLEEK